MDKTLTRSKRFELLILIAILLAALALRLWGIGFGLPYAYHIDEHSYVVGALNLGQGEIYGYPQQVGLVNVLFGEYALYYVTGRVFDSFQSTQDFASSYHINPTTFYLIGRVTIALMGVLTSLVVYHVGKQLRNRRVGLIAALFVAVNFLHVRESHFTTPDVPQCLGFAGVVLLCLLALKTQRSRYLYIASLVGGIVVSYKWASLPLMLPLWFVAWQMGGHDSFRGTVRRLVFSSLVAFGGFAVFSPQILLFPRPYIEWARRDYIAGSAGGYGGFLIDIVPGWLFYFKALLIGFGIVGVALSIIGMILWARRLIATRDRGLMVVVILFIGYFALMASSRRYFVRYAVPLVPLIALSAAEAVAWVQSRWFANNRRSYAVAFTLIGIALVVQPVIASARMDYLWGQEDTRTIAKHWIEENIPNGAVIATDWAIHGVPLATPDVPQPFSNRAYAVTTVGGEGLSAYSLEYYRGNRFDYLIVTSYIYNLEMIDRTWDERRDSFYESLDTEFELIREFKPYAGETEPPFMFDHIYGPLTSLWQWQRPGPTIKIYRVVP